HMHCERTRTLYSDRVGGQLRRRLRHRGMLRPRAPTVQTRHHCHLSSHPAKTGEHPTTGTTDRLLTLPCRKVSRLAQVVAPAADSVLFCWPFVHPKPSRNGSLLRERSFRVVRAISASSACPPGGARQASRRRRSSAARCAPARRGGLGGRT